MCGIFGVINFNGQPVDKEKVLSARDVLAHRGPDDSGIYYSTCHSEPVEKSISHSSNHSVALAHRRLSIIDLSPAAHQPMVSDDGRYVIVFNGEIFNYEEIKSQVGSMQSAVGNNFKTNSDTEVILKLFALEGPDCLKRLRGMFAFAIWDDKEKKLFAARDRFGIKPFYYLHNKNEFIFSSELKAIKNFKNGLTLSMQGMDAFLRTGSVPAPLTIYEETKSLMPGCYLEFNASDKLCTKTYWSFTDLLNHSVNLRGLQNDRRTFTSKVAHLKYDESAKKIVRTSLLDSIRAHMVSDVEVGAFLSGGIDSTAIVSLMRQAGQEKIKTISVTFPGNKLDESQYSNIAAMKFQTDHFDYRLQEDELITDFGKIIEAMDQPTIDGINTYFVSKAAASFGLKVVLSGLGGDELFGGYSSFINIPKYQKIKSIPFAKSLMKAAGIFLKKQFPAKAIEYFNNPNSMNAEYKLIRGLFTDEELQVLGWRSDSRRTSFAGMTRQAEMTDSRPDYTPFRQGKQTGMTEVGTPSFRPSSESDGESLFYQNPESSIQYPVSSIQYVSFLESCFYMRNQLLRDSDVFSMAHSLELRVPFVDHMLYSTVLPFLDDGYDKSFLKKMLVDAVTDLPDEIVHRSKQGFTFPFADWMKTGKIKEEINSALTDSKMKNDFNPRALLNLNDEFQKNKIHWSRVWALFVMSRFGG